MRSIGLLLTLTALLNSAFAGVDALEEAMVARYAPYAERGSFLSAISSSRAPVESWWKSPNVMRSERAEGSLPLSGLHLALDPGHIGGEWAEHEGRHFRISPEDFPVREGELVLEVAKLVKKELSILGAEVTLLREDYVALNPKEPKEYLDLALRRIHRPGDVSLAALAEYALALRREMIRQAIVIGELAERARLLNHEVRPDAVLSLHINAAPWPESEEGKPLIQLVQSNHTHVLIFGCLSESELSLNRHRVQTFKKVKNGSGPIEEELGEALGEALGQWTNLLPSEYSGKNAVRLEGRSDYLWARNLMLLRLVECPIVLLEPYVANSEEAYPRLQKTMFNRTAGDPLAEDDLLVEYAAGVVAGVLKVYGPSAD